MNPFTALTNRFRTILYRNRLEQEMSEEISFHLEARIEFGALETHKHDMRSAFCLQWFDDLQADLRYAARVLRANRSFTAIAILSLALAIGANTTIFSLANQMLYLRLGVPHPEQLRILTLGGRAPLVIHSSWNSRNTEENGYKKTDVFTYPIYRQLQANNRTLSPIAAFMNLGRVNITANGEAQAGMAQLVSGNFYTELQIDPQLGRPILPSDDGSPIIGAVALISDSLWNRAFGRSPSAVGSLLNVNGIDVTIIGVNPRGFTGAQSAQSSPEVFLPLSMVAQLQQSFNGKNPLTDPTLWWVNLIARVQPKVSAAQVSANLNTAFTAAVQGTMKLNKGDNIPTVLVNDGSRGLNPNMSEFAQPLHVLLALAGLVLLLACANIANLMLARGTAREREMSVRLALGASRTRVLRQILTESLLISTLGGTFGLVLAFLGRNVLPALMELPWQTNRTMIAFNWQVFGFAAAITIATGLLFGLLPAWRSSQGDLNRSLKEAGRSATRRRHAWTGKSIVAFQLALSTLLVASSALFLRTLINLNHVQPGFRTQGLLMVDLAASTKRYPGHRSVELTERIEEAFRTIPGVQAVAFAKPPLLANEDSDTDFNVENDPYKKKHQSESIYPNYSRVGEQFLPMMNIRILRGRNFVTQDTASSAKVSIINQALARHYFPNQDPIGRRFNMGDGPDGKTKIFYTIIGVCADTLYSSVRQPVKLLHFELYRQNDDAYGGTYILSTTIATTTLIPTLRQTVQRIDPDIPLTNIRTQQEQIDADLQQERLFASLTTGFGILALLLACVGIYGIMSYTVTQRTNEIGIRLALGAPRATVRTMILGESTLLAIAGILTGLAVTLVMVRLVKTMLYGLRFLDPPSLIATALILLAVALAAGYIPAARASRVEPIEALRHE